MCKKLMLLSGLVLALCFVSNASAQLPAGWSSQDIGTQDGGSASESGGEWTVIGGGGDIWNTSDNFHYAYVELPGDGQITARVTNIAAGTSTWAKGGVMIRDDLTGPSTHAMSVMTSGGGNGASFQWRPTTGSASNNADFGSAVTTPYWVRLVKKASELTSYYSADGTTWNQQGATQTIPMTGSNYAGLCVTAHTDDAAGELRTITFDNVLVEVSKLASGPTPTDGSIYTQGTFVSLAWSPGPTAATQDVYFGENYDDVLNGTGGTLLGDGIAGTTKWFILGLATYPHPDPLEYGKTYYWRIDSIESDGTPYAGDVWSFDMPAWKATEPVPADGSAIVPVDEELSWSKGYNSVFHYVNISTDYDTVANAALGSGEQTGLANFDPTTVLGVLQPDTTYYWRVDEQIPPAVWNQGDVWSFTTAPEGITGELLREKWEGGIGIGALETLVNNWIDYGTRPPDETEAVTGGFYWDGPDTDNYGARISGWVYAPATGDYTFWIVTDDNGRLYLSSDETPQNMTEIARETGWRGPNDFATSGEEVSAPIPLVAGRRYFIQAIWQEGGGGDNCQVGWAGPGIGTSPTTISSNYLSPFDPVEAYGEFPLDGAADVRQDPILTWNAGKYAASHDVYFGTDATAVASATKASPEFKTSTLLGVEKFDPGVLELSKTYYWRVEEANSTHPDSPWTGEVWSFTTGDFVVIDDIEDYNNFSPDTVWESWVDGWGDNSNGSTAGYPEPDFNLDETYVERSVVHGGEQSMPLFYDNSGKASWITRTLPAHLRDWTQEGVKALSLWYQGRPPVLGGFTEAPAGTYTVTGEGADIWDGEDHFHFVYKMMNGPGTITTKVESFTRASNIWAKAGVMIRETLDPNSVNAFALVSYESNRARMQIRPDTAAASTGAGDALNITVAPHWIRLERTFSGDFITSHANDVGGFPDVWTVLDTQNVQMAANAYVGLAVTSHAVGEPATAVFSNVTSNGTGGWSSTDIGIESNGADDMFVMIKDTAGQTATVNNPDPDAANVTSWTEWGSLGQGIALSEFTAKNPALNLSSIDTITLGMGTMGSQQFGGSGLMFIDDIRLYKPMCIPQLAKPALDFSNNCVVDMLDLEILTDNWLNQPANLTETVWGGAWSNSDVGTTNPAGSFTIDGGGNFTITGAGADIWGNADGFHFASQALSGDGQITVQINSLDNTNGWAKAGVMIRDTMDPGSTHAFMAITPSNGAAMQFRDVADGGSTNWQTTGLQAPISVSISRVGDTLTGYYSTPNGWVQRGSIDIPMTDPVRIGIAVTSHNDGTACTATGDRNTPALILETDANADGITNFQDYAVLIDAWLDEVLWP